MLSSSDNDTQVTMAFVKISCHESWLQRLIDSNQAQLVKKQSLLIYLDLYKKTRSELLSHYENKYAVIAPNGIEIIDKNPKFSLGGQYPCVLDEINGHIVQVGHEKVYLKCTDCTEDFESVDESQAGKSFGLFGRSPGSEHSGLDYVNYLIKETQKDVEELPKVCKFIQNYIYQRQDYIKKYRGQRIFISPGGITLSSQDPSWVASMHSTNVTVGHESQWTSVVIKQINNEEAQSSDIQQFVDDFEINHEYLQQFNNALKKFKS